MNKAPDLRGAFSRGERGRRRRTASAPAGMRAFVGGKAGGRRAVARLRRRRATLPYSKAPPTCTSSALGGSGPGRRRRRQPRRWSVPESARGAVAPASSL